MLFAAWWAISAVCAVAWVLDEALDFIFRPFGSEVVAVTDGDVAASLGGSGGGTGGWGVSSGAVARLGSVCRRFWGFWGWGQSGGGGCQQRWRH